MQLTAKILAELLGGEIEGNPEVLVSKPSRIEEGGVGTISFLGNEKYEAYAYQTDASILLVSRDFSPRQPIRSTLIRVDNVYQAIAVLLEKFGQQNHTPAVISDSAVIHPDARIGAEVSIGPAAVVEAGVQIGEHSRIGAQVYLGQNVKIGKGVLLYPGVRILKDCELGDNCIIHANTVIGSDGFGFTPQTNGSYRKVPHVGNVVIESDVEIGANSAIDRASIGSTIIRQGVKLDNLVHIAHNVEIGAHSALAGQVGVAGSTKIGKHCRIGGQVGIAGHISIADQTQIQAQSGIASSVKTPGTALFGSPAIAYKDFIRSFIIFKRLPELYRRLTQLEKASGHNGSDDSAGRDEKSD
jgi:UDP-3-O-[3-hydroxymyristoyl] glucosamine N-acyltransferase